MLSRKAITLAAVCGLLIFPFSLQAQEATQMNRLTPEILWKMGRLGGGTVSPDGMMLAYTVRHYDVAKNKGTSSLIVQPVGGTGDQLAIEGWSSISDIQWVVRDGRPFVYFSGKPAKSEDENGEADESADDPPIDTPQVWSFDANTGETIQLTAFEDGISNLKVSPAGTHIAFTADVKMDKEVTEIYEDLPEAEARIIDSLMYRHWNAWHDFKYSHLFIAEIDADGRMVGEARDTMAGIRADTPVPPFGGSEQFNWSPDGSEIAFTMKDVEDWAESTDSDVYVVSVNTDEAPKNITAGQTGYDNNPVYSPNGQYLAYQSMERASFESDRNRIMIIDRATGQQRDLTAGLDQTTHEPTWLPDSSGMLFSSEYRGTNQIFKVALDSPGVTQVSSGRVKINLQEVFNHRNSALVSKMSMLRPRELSVLSLDEGVDRVVTHINDMIYANLELPRIEERWVDATDGKKIHCWVIMPPDFDPAAEKKWPMLAYFQGGPQGQIGQWFSFRWNFHMMAANGYVVVAPNRRGLPGFGREWNDQISGDWGGQAMQDLLSATDAMTKEPYIDAERVAGIGASFGGYTAYWMMGNHNDRYCAMISHCGVYNLESMYGSTEELFFVNWDLGGPFWSDPAVKEKYEQFSPHNFAGKWSIPLLVIHGEKDFRVPITQGMEAFTAAQVQDVPSRFLYFPNEGHWVMSPQNSIVWFRVFFEWLDEHCKNGGEAEE
ncbi:MAG: S9 family peptidase [Planctomycetota bacterium]